MTDTGAARPGQPEDLDFLYAVAPPWDIGRPQPAFVSLARAGAIRGRVLDVGCGTGEHALMAAEVGLDATGVDMARAAIEAAKRKAQDRASAPASWSGTPSSWPPSTNGSKPCSTAACSTSSTTMTAPRSSTT